MSVLTNLMTERCKWADEFKAQQRRRNRVMVLQSIVLLMIGMAAVIHYNRILAAVMVWFTP